MAIANYDSYIDMGLPAAPLLRETDLRSLIEEFQLVYGALQALQLALTDQKIAFDAYVATHP